jgi:hypothetical protein
MTWSTEMLRIKLKISIIIQIKKQIQEPTEVKLALENKMSKILLVDSFLPSEKIQDLPMLNENKKEWTKKQVQVVTTPIHFWTLNRPSTQATMSLAFHSSVLPKAAKMKHSPASTVFNISMKDLQHWSTKSNNWGQLKKLECYKVEVKTLFKAKEEWGQQMVVEIRTEMILMEELFKIWILMMIQMFKKTLSELEWCRRVQHDNLEVELLRDIKAWNNHFWTSDYLKTSHIKHTAFKTKATDSQNHTKT